MVTHLNIALDDEEAERVRSVKEDMGLTWAEFLDEAASALEGTRVTHHVPEIGETREVDDSEVSEPEIEDLDLPGSGDKLDQRRKTIQRLYDYLRQNGTAKKSDFLELIDAEEVGYSSEESFWSNCVKGRDSLADLPGVASPGEGEHTWHWVGE